MDAENVIRKYNFNDLINLIKEKISNKEKIKFGFQNYGEWKFGEMEFSILSNPYDFDLTDPNIFCQELYDSLINEFGEQIETGSFWNDLGVARQDYYMFLNKRNIQIWFNGRLMWVDKHIKKEETIRKNK